MDPNPRRKKTHRLLGRTRKGKKDKAKEKGSKEKRRRKSADAALFLA